MIKKLTYTRIAGLIFFLLFSNWSIGQIETRHIGKNFFVESNSNLVVVGAGSIYNGNPGFNSMGVNIAMAHTHSVDMPNQSITGGAHQHTGTTGGPSSTMNRCACVSGAVGDGSHTHTFTTNAGDGAHTHNTNVASFNSGGATNTENRPPYFAVYYIMKL